MFEYNVNIRYVYDGDTVTADVDLGFYTWLKNQKFRLIDINTPEIRTKDKDEKKRGYAARDFLREILKDAKCSIKCKGKGKYGRWLVELYKEGEKKSINQILLDKNYAEPYMEP